MAERKKDVSLRKFLSGAIEIYSDLTEAELKSVPGVVAVVDLTESLGFMNFWVDPRYDGDEVVKEISEMATEKTARCQAKS